MCVHATRAHARGVSGDTVQLIATGLVPGDPCLFFSGKNAVNGGAGVAFGDGLRCAGYDAVRLQITASDATGNSITTSAVGGGLVGGDTRYYQCWYRDNTGVCGSSHNTTNGLAITWDN